MADADSDHPEPLDRLLHEEFRADGSWAAPPRRWRRNPEDKLIEGELLGRIEEIINGLPDSQRIVVTLRDIEGWETQEIAEFLGRSRNWTRVVLHRGRVKIREAVGDFMEEGKQ